MLRIDAVHKNSQAYKAGLQEGDIIRYANGKEIHDALDFQFYIENERRVELAISRDGNELSITLNNILKVATGIEPEKLKLRHCGNNCVFCFIDQQPQGLRESLYVKDEDVRFSFIHGNFVTLTNTPEWEFERIIEQRMSPLYISVHSTNEIIRRKLLGNNKIRPILPLLKRLCSSGVQIHTQIVVVPNYNSDLRELETTIHELDSLGENSVSCALVPVGLSKYRKDLPKITPVSTDIARSVIETTNRLRAGLERPEFLQVADEFFLKAGIELPSEEFYGDFPQLENGVGMARLFIDDAKNLELKGEFKKLLQDRKIELITGLAMEAIFSKYLPDFPLKVTGITNQFWGESVTVANLLTGSEILPRIQESKAEYILLPPNILNNNDLFLDDISFNELKTSTRAQIITGYSYLSEIQQHIINNL